MIPKYKLSDVAKDFGSTVQEVGAVLEGVSEGAKKPNTVLTEEELNVVFEHFTSKNAVANFNEYFASADIKPVKKEEKKAEEKPAAPVPEKQPKRKAEEPVRAEKKEEPAKEKRPSRSRRKNRPFLKRRKSPSSRTVRSRENLAQNMPSAAITAIVPAVIL